MAFFCLTCSRFDAAGAIEIGVTSFQLLVSSLTHALTRYRSEGRSETHRFAGVALSTTLCKLGVQHPFVDQQEKDVCVSGQL